MSRHINEMIDQCKSKQFCVFTDLDYTCCVADNAEYEQKNITQMGVKRCFMHPEFRQACLNLHARGCLVFFVTGRHWSDQRFDEKLNAYVPDGALNDLLGGKSSPFADFYAIAGHGRQIVRHKKVRVLKRTQDPTKQKAELKFERYVGGRILDLKQKVLEKFPQAQGFVEAGYKKHTSYINILTYPSKNPQDFESIFLFMQEQVAYILKGKDKKGNFIKAVPENIEGTFVSSIDLKGSVDIRSLSQNKGKALLESGFLEQAYNTDMPVLVLGDSLGINGTDRDMFLCIQSFFQKRNALNRVFFIHVLNTPNNRILNHNDPCYPDIVFSSVEELAKTMTFITE